MRQERAKRARGVLTVVGLCLLLGIAGAALARDELPINVYPCPRAATPPALDGRLDDPVWQQAPVVSGFVYFGKTKLTEVQTSVRVLYDSKYLYFGIRCDEPLMDKLSPVVFARDEHGLFGGEAIELFVDPNHTHDTYYQLACNAAGSLYDGRREDTAWNSETVVKGSPAADSWSLEVAIPWSSLGATPTDGKVVGFNVCRDRNLGERQWTTWAQVQNGFHDPYRFAHLVLSGKPETISKLSDELRRGERSGPIVIYSAEGFSRTTYKGLAATSLADIDRLLADLAAEGRRDGNAATAAELDKRLAAYRTQVAALREQAGGNLDAASWTRLDVQMQQTIIRLRTVIWDARLTALLGEI